jgi:hypothetical protein
MKTRPHWGSIYIVNKDQQLQTDIDSERIDSRIFVEKLFSDRLLIKKPAVVCVERENKD